MLEIETFYWLPHCSTCIKAEHHLKDGGARIKNYVNLKESPLSQAVIASLAEGLNTPDGRGGIEKLFSKRAMKYRSMGLHEQTLSEDDMLRWMGEEYTFITRPVIVSADGQVLSGYSKKRYDALLSS